MSVIDIILRAKEFAPLVTKKSNLTSEELDENFIEIYKAIIETAIFENIDRSIVDEKFSFELNEKIKFSLINITSGSELGRIENIGIGIAIIILRNGTGLELTINENSYIKLGNDSIILEKNESEVFIQIDDKSYLIGKSGLVEKLKNGDVKFGNIDEVASEENEGKIRYRKYIDGDYFSVIEMCMQTADGVYEWLEIKKNQWV